MTALLACLWLGVLNSYNLLFIKLTLFASSIIPPLTHIITEKHFQKGDLSMNYKYEKNIYDDGNIPEIDLPQDTGLPPTQNRIGNDKNRSEERRVGKECG